MWLKINHPKIHRVDDAIFKLTFTPDCMAHRCCIRGKSDRPRMDACCQYGADVLIPEKEAILRRRAEIASVLEEDRRDPEGWFDERDPERDPDAPAGIILRTATVDPDREASGCVFLEHTGERGCGLHRAALLHGFAPAEIKPVVCRLYPLSAHGRRLGLSPDFSRYSCANDAGPTLYQLMRAPLGESLGMELIDQLDRLESELSQRKLRVLPRAAVPRQSAAD